MDEALTDPIEIRQGDFLSSIFNSQLNIQLRLYGKKVKIIRYADETLLKFQSKDDIQTMLHA